MASQGTGCMDVRISSGTGTSGMRFKKWRLTMPLMPLRKKYAANCHDCGWFPNINAETRNATQLATPMKAWSAARKRPRNWVGTSEEIQGSQAQLEMPRRRLKMKSRKRISESLACDLRKAIPGISAIAKMKKTRLPQPAYTNFL